MVEEWLRSGDSDVPSEGRILRNSDTAEQRWTSTFLKSARLHQPVRWRMSRMDQVVWTNPRLPRAPVRDRC